MSSIKDVARLAGVSVSTVSRVIRGSGRVEEDTRIRIEKAIDAINYRPNLLAQGLRSNVGLVIGLVLPETPHETFASFVLHTERACAALGYSLIVGNGHPDSEVAFIDTLLRRRVDGIIFSRVSDRSNVLAVLKRWGTPAVTIDRVLDREETPTVGLDNFKAGEMAANHLISLGHRHFGIITGPQDIAISRERMNGFVSAVGTHGLTMLTSDIYEGDFGYDSGIRAGESFIGKGITAVWGQNDLMAIGAMNAFINHGLQVPGDVSVMGMDDTNFSRMTLPALTTMSQPWQEMCRAAVEMIISIKTGGSFHSRRVVLQPSLVARDSTACPASEPMNRIEVIA